MSMLQKEIPMYSPHPKGKLFKQFDERTQLPLNPEELMDEEEYRNWQLEMNNYRHFKEFKWIFETEISNAQGTDMPGLVNRQLYVAVKTNTLHDIQPGDVVYLRCNIWPQGRYFIVTSDVKQDYAYTPKMRPTYKHIELKGLA